MLAVLVPDMRFTAPDTTAAVLALSLSYGEPEAAASGRQLGVG